ncbi:hypothetical protein [Streptomyces sp. NPDC047108]|uniref:hypothetical protein n=1 Tax=Streptomyces sp. NPDC047108 TaxID=3155025 RepID=UPI0033EEC0BE
MLSRQNSSEPSPEGHPAAPPTPRTEPPGDAAASDAVAWPAPAPGNPQAEQDTGMLHAAHGSAGRPSSAGRAFQVSTSAPFLVSAASLRTTKTANSPAPADVPERERPPVDGRERERTTVRPQERASVPGTAGRPEHARAQEPSPWQGRPGGQTRERRQTQTSVPAWAQAPEPAPSPATARTTGAEPAGARAAGAQTASAQAAAGARTGAAGSARADEQPAARPSYGRRAAWVMGSACALYATGLVLSLTGATPIAPRTLLPLPGVPTSAPIGGNDRPSWFGDGFAGRSGPAASSSAKEGADDASASASPSASETSDVPGATSASPPADGKGGGDVPHLPGDGSSPSTPAQDPTSTPSGGDELPSGGPTSSASTPPPDQTAPPTGPSTGGGGEPPSGTG